jgi:diacylglycerol kinase (ATP)
MKPMHLFQHIAIIFNPNSTGDAPSNARDMAAGLKEMLPKTTVSLLPTESAGHAVELAYDFAKKYHNPLIISASGDGGYNEVINGALRAQDEGAIPTCAVLPSGNANDHARTMHGRPLIELIRDGSVAKIDVLELAADSAGKDVRRYAHSYIGLGLSPKVGLELNKHKLNTFVEAWLVARALLRLRPITIEADGRTQRLDSLVCSTIPEMAKILSLSHAADPQDGLFELTEIPHRHKLALLAALLKGLALELGASKQLKKYSFSVPQPTLVQCDGEIIRMAAGSQVEITIKRGLLRTVAGPAS